MVKLAEIYSKNKDVRVYVNVSTIAVLVDQQWRNIYASILLSPYQEYETKIIKTEHIIGCRYSKVLDKSFIENLNSGFIILPDKIKIELGVKVAKNLELVERSPRKESRMLPYYDLFLQTNNKPLNEELEKIIERELMLSSEPYDGLDDLKEEMGLSWTDQGVLIMYAEPKARITSLKDHELAIESFKRYNKGELELGLIWRLADGSVKRESLLIKDYDVVSKIKGSTRLFSYKVSLSVPSNWFSLKVILRDKRVQDILDKRVFRRVSRLEPLSSIIGDYASEKFLKVLEEALLEGSGSEFEKAFVVLLNIAGLSPIWLIEYKKQKTDKIVIDNMQYGLDMLLIEDKDSHIMSIYLFSLKARDIEDKDLEDIWGLSQLIKKRLDKLYQRIFINLYPFVITNHPVSDDMKKRAKERNVWIVDRIGLQNIVSSAKAGLRDEAFIRTLFACSHPPCPIGSL